MSSTPSYASVHALSAGYLTLPERFFVTPLEDQDARTTVPSLSFLIQHHDAATSTLTRIVFDLGIRRDISQYPAPIRKHAATREPLTSEPDVVSSLAAGGLAPNDIDFVIYSHVHWDHIGMPSDFPKSRFVLGAGAAELLSGESKLSNGSHSFFEADLLPFDRTIILRNPELPSTPPPDGDQEDTTGVSRGNSKTSSNEVFRRPWLPQSSFPHTMDIFGDGSCFVVSAPGHLPGHLNLLCRLDGGKFVYLAGDSCHDPRLLSGEKDVATWVDEGHSNTICCIHADKETAARTLGLIRNARNGDTELGDVEVIFAHDAVWDKEAREQKRFFPGQI